MKTNCTFLLIALLVGSAHGALRGQTKSIRASFAGVPTRFDQWLPSGVDTKMHAARAEALHYHESTLPRYAAARAEVADELAALEKAAATAARRGETTAASVEYRIRFLKFSQKQYEQDIEEAHSRIARLRSGVHGAAVRGAITASRPLPSVDYKHAQGTFNWRVHSLAARTTTTLEALPEALHGRKLLFPGGDSPIDPCGSTYAQLEHQLHNTQHQAEDAQRQANTLKKQIPLVADTMDKAHESQAQEMQRQLDHLQGYVIPMLQRQQKSIQRQISSTTVCGLATTAFKSLVKAIESVANDIAKFVADHVCQLIALAISCAATAIDMGIQALQPELAVDAVMCKGFDELKKLPLCSGGKCVVKPALTEAGLGASGVVCKHASKACKYTNEQILNLGLAMYDAACGNFASALWDTVKPFVMCSISIGGDNCGHKIGITCPADL